MPNSYVGLLSLLVFLPALGALVLAFFPKDKPGGMKIFSLGVCAATFLLNLMMVVADGSTWQFKAGVRDMQMTFNLPWIPSFNISYFMGTDGISFPLVLLTTFSCLLAMGASWNIQKHVKAYCILFLLLETGMTGVFLALDFFLFYVFWEVMLLPMYFLIGVWGGPRREYAAIKFFLYTLFGSVLMLIAILMLYYSSDVRELNAQQLTASRVIAADKVGKPDAAAADAIHKSKEAVHTFNILALQQIGQTTKQFDDENRTFLGHTIAWWSFLLLFIGFAIKVPSVPLHTWLPDAHVEAPTPISMLLAGVLLKMGGYGILRICYPICPAAGYDLAWFVCGIGVLSMVYGAFAALAQKDFKRLVAYSSVSHMGYVVLGLGIWSARAGTQFNPEFWSMGVSAAMFQMIAHGISSPGMFFMVGIIYDRVHHRNLDEFGGLAAKMPVYFGLAIVLFFAGLGLPGLCGFWGEAFVTLAAWKFSIPLAVISASVVILTAAYILWTIQRVWLGPEYKGPHGDHITPITPRELAIAAPLVALAILLGVYPKAVFDYVNPTVQKQVGDLAEWTKINRPAVNAAKTTVPDNTTKRAQIDNPPETVAKREP